MLSRKKALEERVELLNKVYDEWFFAVTNRNKVKRYKKLGNSVDIRYVKRRLNKLIKMVKKPKKIGLGFLGCKISLSSGNF